MSNSKLATWLSDQGQPLVKQARHFRTVVDPEQTPFNSKYEAITLYTNLLQSLESIATEEPSDRVHLLQLCLHSEAAFTSIDVEDNITAERSLRSAIEVVVDRLKLPFLVRSFDSNDEASGSQENPSEGKLHISLALVLIALYNTLGYLKSMKLNFASSVAFFKEAETLYHAWEKNPTTPKLAPLTLQDLLSADPSALTIAQLSTHLAPIDTSSDRTEIGKAYTMTIYYLAQAYQQTGDYADSARYCHMTLKQQHRWLGTGELAVDHVEWALNSATLSQYFSANEQYNVARHLIACARHVWKQTTEEAKAAEEERWKKAGADLDRIEVKYCLALLDESYRLLANNEMSNYPVVEWKFAAFLLNDPEVARAEAALPAFPVRDNAAAKLVVRHALAAIDSAKSFFNLNDRASDYVDCTFDHCAIFGALLPYEPAVDNRCKMVKRRIDMLEALAGQLNPQYFLQHVRKIHYELGDIYSQLVGLKYIAHENDFAKQQAAIAGGDTGASSSAEIDKNVTTMKKINLLTVKSIQHYYIFLRSFETLNPGKKASLKVNDPLPPFEKLEMFPLPRRIDEGEQGNNSDTSGCLQAIITAYLAIGRMYIKIVTSNPGDRVRYWLQCEKYYKALREYLERNRDQRAEFFSEYWTQLEEMLTLIPGKIQSILAQSL